MRVNQASSAALFLMFLLLGQAMAANLNQIPSDNVASPLDSSDIVMASNNTGGNNTGGNNTGGNNTGGNNTGGNNTGGNNTGGNNTGGNNTGGNNTGGNNTGGNNTGNDTDGDGIYDVYDDCPNGYTNWTSSATTDYDSDGCKDSTEDLDDDNDGVLDASDLCPQGNLGWTSTNSTNSNYTTDYDSDGCKDSNEDTDDDNDGVSDAYDDCQTGDLGWTSNNSTDADADGCRDATEEIQLTISSLTNSFYIHYIFGVSVSTWNLNYSVSNYYGNIYWNATSEDGVLYSAWSTYVYSNTYQSTSQENFYANGNYTVCASTYSQTNSSNGTNTEDGASDCMIISVYIPPPMISIAYSTNNTYYQYSTWDFNYSVSNYYGDIYWNATSEDGVFYSQWTTDVYSYSNESASQEYFYTNGNYTVCASTYSQTNSSNGTNTGDGASDCIVISVYIQPATLTISSLTNNTYSQYSTWNFNYLISNYNGSIYWNATSENGLFNSAWSTYANSESNQNTTTQANFYTDGNYTVCASTYYQTNSSNGTNTGNGASDCIVISVYFPSPMISITDSINDPNNQSLTWNFNYSVSNYYGDIYWIATSENGVFYSAWTTYVYSSSYESASQENFYAGGNYTVCASTYSQTNSSNGMNTGNGASDCIIIVHTYSQPVPCGNSSTLAFSNTSSVYTLDQPITFSIIVDCGIGENSFYIQGGLFDSYGQNGTDGSGQMFEYQGYSVILPSEFTFTFNAVNESGDYYIAVNIDYTGWVQWNFTIYGDDDNDGVNGQIDNCIGAYNPNQNDLDGDGLGDACDLDIDGDGIDNQVDVFPSDGNESIDTDNDGIGNNADTDDDGDGMVDSDDAFPLSPTEQTDFDGDGVGDNLDADDDGDGISDVSDNCPLVANADQADLDGDGIGTACDGIELTVSENGTIEESGNAIPSIGMVGTVVAISAGFFIAIRREDEE